MRRCGKSGERFEEFSETIEEPLPTVAFIGDEALQHRGGCLFLAGGNDGDFTEERGDARESSNFGEESANFDIGVFAGLHAAENLQYELIAEEN